MTYIESMLNHTLPYPTTPYTPVPHPTKYEIINKLQSNTGISQKCFNSIALQRRYNLEELILYTEIYRIGWANEL